MIDPLYQKEILRLAAAADGAGRLDTPTASATVKNPLCGDQITVDLVLSGPRIDKIAHHTRACVLCQASAALLARLAAGKDKATIDAARQRLRELLTGTTVTSWPDGFDGFDAFEVFAVVAPHKNRHTCVTLPFEALDKAFTAAMESAAS